MKLGRLNDISTPAFVFASEARQSNAMVGIVLDCRVAALLAKTKKGISQ